MAGAHIDREAAFERTGMTVAQRDAYIRQLRGRGFALKDIAKVTGLSVSSVHYIVNGRAPQVKPKFCEGCWEEFPASEVRDGLCRKCRS